MKLYEIDIMSLWWVAAADEMEAMDLLREELFTIEVSEEEMDGVMNDLTIKELAQEEAETIGVYSDCGDLSDLWSMFAGMFGSGLVYSDYHREEEEEETYHEEGYAPEDWCETL